MTDWTLAGCLGDPEAMYEDDAAAVAYNRRVCAACPIRQACLQRALDLREPWGMWGGLTAAERGRLVGAVLKRPAERHLKPCGTDAARRRHQRVGERCVVCGVRDNPAQRAAWPAQRERANRRRVEARTEHRQKESVAA